jgi:acyl-CoA-binding protein
MGKKFPSFLTGPYQPSHDMMLLFYSYYKQATLGPCNIPKPAFWDVVNKAKWNAWSGLGQMTKEEAMTRYVEEIKKVSNIYFNMHVNTDVHAH